MMLLLTFLGVAISVGALIWQVFAWWRPRQARLHPRDAREIGDSVKSAAPAVLPRTTPGLNLPPRNINFTGRERQLATLQQALVPGKTTSVALAIWGLGGIGKTQLALEYSYRHLKDHPVTWWLHAEQPTTLALDYAALAVRLNLPEKDAADQSQTITAVRAWLERNQGWLLVFDDAPDPAAIQDYLPKSFQGCIIITSRHPTWSGIAEELDIQVLSRPEAVEFILKRTRTTDKRAAGVLADALSCLPLALEQAAAYIVETAGTVEHYLALLETNRPEVLKRRSRDAQYPNSVATTWELSIRRVEQDSTAGAALLNLAAFLAPDDIPLDLLFAKEAKLPAELAPAQADPIQFDQARATLRGLSLARFQGDSMSVHGLVQAVTADRLGRAAEKWAEAAAVAVDSVFPEKSNDVRSWPLANRLLKHALSASRAAEKAHVATEHADRLLTRVDLFLTSRCPVCRVRTDIPRARQDSYDVSG